MARVRMRLLVEWDVDDSTMPEGPEEFMRVMEFFAKNRFVSATAFQTYIERNVPEEE
jgi:hypothetical protein